MGWAQLHRKQGMSQKQLFELDQYYISHQSLRLDFKIMYQSLLAVFTRQFN